MYLTLRLKFPKCILNILFFIPFAAKMVDCLRTCSLFMGACMVAWLHGCIWVQVFINVSNVGFVDI